MARTLTKNKTEEGWSWVGANSGIVGLEETLKEIRAEGPPSVSATALKTFSSGILIKKCFFWMTHSGTVKGQGHQDTDLEFGFL